MAWQCVMYEEHPSVPLWKLKDVEISPHGMEIEWVPWKELPVGAMWFNEEEELCVMLPSGEEWNIDRGRKLGIRPRWNRTGTPPNITVMPSINHVGEYHGFLRDGKLTDDIEGRTYG